MKNRRDSRLRLDRQKNAVREAICEIEKIVFEFRNRGAGDPELREARYRLDELRCAFSRYFGGDEAEGDLHLIRAMIGFTFE